VAVATKSTGVIVQSWVSPQLAAELKRYAEAERRSVSAAIRLALTARAALLAPCSCVADD
jgi:hypothetical protein